MTQEETNIVLSKFERDLLESMPNQYFTFWNCPELCEMKRRGYFKGIDNRIEDVISSSEPD